MREETFYKVLWVEDDLSIIQGYQIIAESKDIEPSSWTLNVKLKKQIQ